MINTTNPSGTTGQPQVELIGCLSNFELPDLSDPDDHAVERVVVDRQMRQLQRRLGSTDLASLVLAYQGGAGINELASRFRIHRGTVRQLLEREQVDLRTRGLDEAGVAEAVRLYADGESLAKIGEHFGVHATTVWRALRAAGVEIRPRLRRAG